MTRKHIFLLVWDTDFESDIDDIIDEDVDSYMGLLGLESIG